jgi:succinoglycan biosynthesis protein ExoA
VVSKGAAGSGEALDPGEDGLRVLVVVPTLNEAHHIGGVLESLLGGLRSPAAVEVVVADGGSTDATRALVERVMDTDRRVQLMDSPGRIQSCAVNLAARRFGRDADVLVRCDAHAEYPPDFCRRLLDALKRSEADAVVVSMDSVGDDCLQRAVAWVSNSLVGTGGSAHRAGRVSGFVDHGHHAAFRMESFRRVGGYDESFSHNEDAEFDCRQRALGARVYLDADIRVKYRPRSTFAALFRQYLRYGAGRSRTVRRHPGSLRLRQLVVPTNLAFMALAVALSPWTRLPLLWPATYACVLLATSAGMTVKHRSACGLLAGPVAATMHLAWACGFFLGLAVARERRWRLEMTVPLWSDAA